jgi:hypothetical protein
MKFIGFGQLMLISAKKILHLIVKQQFLDTVLGEGEGVRVRVKRRPSPTLTHTHPQDLDIKF